MMNVRVFGTAMLGMGLMGGIGLFADIGNGSRAFAAPPPGAAGAASPPRAQAEVEESPTGDGKDSGAQGEAGAEGAESDAEKSREERFAEYMTGATLSGRFTVIGQDDDKMPEEEYKIIKVEKLPEGDLYRFTARIRYGETDTELPMDLPVLWAGDTPVITLTNLWIPGLGTFSSRVLIYRDRYAGTWTHGEVGGHLFGVIKKE